MPRKQHILNFAFAIATGVLFTCCVKPFTPPVTTSGNLNYLVVDGFIVPGSATTIKLSRTLNVADSFMFVPENNAQLFIEGSSGSSFTFQAGNEGVYTSPSPYISQDDTNRRRKILKNGNEYISKNVEVKQ